MNEEKENINGKSKKRKSSMTEEDISPSKKVYTKILSDSDDCDTDINSSGVFDSSFENQISIFSTCLTSHLKTDCKLNQLSTNSNCGTPEEYIIPLSEFKNLPKPQLECEQEIGNSFTQSERTILLTRSKSEPSGIDLSKFNDSFETGSSKYCLQTPINFHFNPSHDTPETPCELSQIDLEKSEEFSRTIKSHFNENIFHKSRMRHLFVNSSPMCYEKEFKKSRYGGYAYDRFACQIGIESPGEPEEPNKIEEISVKAVSEIIENDFTSDLYAYHIIDCRYPYEYDGGHIRGAVNLYTTYQMLSYIFMNNFDVESLQKPLGDYKEPLTELVKSIMTIKKPNSRWKQQAFIFHCEFSSVRGPKMSRCLRNMDRLANVGRYPNLFFPKLYVMKSGYKEFYKQFKRLCEPQSYVPMFTEDSIEDINCEDLEALKDTTDSDCESRSESLVITKIKGNEKEKQLKIYNLCKKQTQEQMELFTNLTKDSRIKEDD